MTLPTPGQTAPDNNYNPASLSAYQTDLGEMAARLGSPDILQRTGRVVFVDDFAGGLVGWSRSLPGPGGNVYASILSPATPGSIKAFLQPPTSGSAYNSIIRSMPLFKIGKVGFECLLSFDNTKPLYINYVDFYHSGNFYEFAIKVDATTIPWTISALGPSSTFYTITTDSIFSSDSVFPSYNYFKWTFDLLNIKYGTLQVNSFQYDLSNLPVPNPTIGISGEILRVIHGSGWTNVSTNISVANVIVTVDEP